MGGSWGGAAGTPSGWGAGVVVEGCRGYPAGLSSARLPLRRPTRSLPCVLQLMVLRCSSRSRDPALVQLLFRVTSYPLSCWAPRGTLAPGPSPHPQGRQLSLPSHRRPAPTLTPGPRERGGSGAPARPRLPVSALQPELPGGEGHRPRLRTPSSDRRGLGRPGPRRLRHHGGAGPFPGQVSCRWTRLHGDPCSRGAWGSGHARRSALAFADRLADLGQQARLPPIRPGGAPQGVAWRVPTSAGQGREISPIGGVPASAGRAVKSALSAGMLSQVELGCQLWRAFPAPPTARGERWPVAWVRGLGGPGGAGSRVPTARPGLQGPVLSLVLPELLHWGPGDARVRGAWPAPGPAGEGLRAPSGQCLQWRWGCLGCRRAPTCPLPGFSRGDPCPQ